MIAEPIEKYFALALELWRTNEGSALALVESVQPRLWPAPDAAPNEKATYDVRGLRRFPPGMQPPRIIDDVRELLDTGAIGEELRQRYVEVAPNRNSPVRSHLYWIVDQTAVGSPMADHFLEKLGRSSAQRVIFGGQHAETESDGVLHIPKNLLISEVQALLEEERLKIAQDHPDAPDLTGELTNYTHRRSMPVAPADDSWREQPNDDLIFAVGLACRRLKTRPFFKWETF
jgi:hypothetical protein